MLKTAKKAAAFITSLMMITSCGAMEAFTVFAATTSSSSSSAVATQMKIYDEDGNDITSNPIIYLDNSSIAGGKTSSLITVKTDNNTSNIDDPIAFATEAFPVGKEVINVNRTETTDNSVTINIAAVTTDSSGKEKALKPGTTTINFSTQSGEVYRTLTVVVYEPASDMKIYLNDKKTELGFTKAASLPDKLTVDNVQEAYDLYGASNYEGGIMTVANHKYQFYADMVASTSTDEVEWVLYDGDYDGTGTKKPGTSKAEITSDGLLTPKSNGMVTLVAKAKATETSDRTKAVVDREITVKVDNAGKPVSQKVKYKDKTLVKYITVLIVKENPAKSLNITNAPTAMEANDTVQLKLSMTPSYTGDGYESGATDEIRWESSNPKIATVDSKGLVTALSKGDVTITAYGENENVFAKCDIRVLTKATSISITPSPASTRVGVGVELTATMLPGTADDEIVWKSSDTSIATVKSLTTGDYGNVQKAVVTGVKTGTVKITATAKNSGVSATCTITVNNRIEADNLTLTTNHNNEISTITSGSTLNLYTLKDIKIDAELVNSDGTTPDDTTVAWTVTGNENAYVTISSETTSSITIHGVSEGTVTVKAASKAKPSISKTFKIKVLRSCDKIVLIDEITDKTVNAKSLNVNDSLSLRADLTIDGNYPYNHSDTVVSWTSSDTSIATVNNSGVITGKANGVVNITAKTASGRTAICKLTVFTTMDTIINSGVVKDPNGIEMPTTTFALNNAGAGTKQLGVQVKNQNGLSVTNYTAKWSSSDESVATVDHTGKITGHKVGTAIITVKSGTKSDSCLLTVTSPLSVLSYDTIEPMVYSPIIKNYEPKPIITFLGKVLVEGTDYKLSYTNNTKVGTATLTVTGIGCYTGTKSVSFKINARPLTDGSVKVAAINKQQCTGKALTPAVSITCDGVSLTKDTDYTVSYSNNTKVGTATVNIAGKGNYTGKLTSAFEIYCNHKNVTVVKEIKAATCTEAGSENVKCNACGETFERAVAKLGHKYVATVIAPTYTAQGYTLHKCSNCGTSYKDNYKSALSRTNLSKCTITLSKTTYTYTGYSIKPVVTVKYGTKTLKSGTDYTVTYSNNLKVGKATVKIVGKNAYTGTITKTFTINPKTVVAKSTYTCTTSEVRINWNKVPDVTGYKIYRYNPSTKKWVDVKAIYSSTAVTYKDPGLKAGTVYKYKVKAFKKIGSTFYWGSSCSTITTTTKPATPTITKTAKSSTAVRLYWKSVTGTGYKVQKYNASTKQWVTVKTIAYGTNNYKIANLKRNTSYTFRVVAYRYDGKTNVLSTPSKITVKTTA